MTSIGFFQIIFYLVVLLLCVYPLGWYMAQVFEGKPCGLDRIGKPIERLIYRCAGIKPQYEMDWKRYLSSMLYFNLLGLLAVYFIQRFQFYLPLNPQHFTAVSSDLAFNTAVSFTTNTNWQAYAGEVTMSYFTQMSALTTQNFISAATGMSLLIALIRGITRKESSTLGNFWVDTVRGVLYILLPLALILSFILTSQGVIQNMKPYQTVKHQEIPMGPVASQVAIKQLGSNGGGFFNTNSSHPFENPTPISNFFEMLAILLIPASLCVTFGFLVNDKRQGWAIFVAMLIVFVPSIFCTVIAEQIGNPAFAQMGIDPIPQMSQYSAGNMEGKEVRFGIVNSAMWATATTATSNGSVNAMHDSFMPMGALVLFWLMHLGQVIFGGVGSGLYGMVMLVIITVFVAGLMVGRTPEYLGKKIEPYEMKMASVAVLVMPIAVLLFTAITVLTRSGVSAMGNPGAHGFAEVLYAFTSMANNNGSAFAGLQSNTPLYNVLGGWAMLLGRYWIAIPMLAIAGSLAKEKTIPSTSGTLLTHTPLFIIMLVSITIIIAALSFVPTLALGPIVEQIVLWRQYAS